MKKSDSRVRTVHLGEARILLSSPESILLVIGTGCILRTAAGTQTGLPSGTLLVREHQERRPFDGAVATAIELMKQKLEQPLRVSALAKAVGVSRAAFARRFVRATGFSPLRFLHTLRLERAAQLLVETDLTLSDIASRVGYVSEFAFSRAFKRHRGLPPSVFRRSSAAPRAMALAA
ncbi:MAG TPA: helix-turn-helix domain-containing protein [Polyangiaceae bacterium]|nr:helix-turn-helix domain-containing protein [Polyangiaceae bacterium]